MKTEWLAAALLVALIVAIVRTQPPTANDASVITAPVARDDRTELVERALRYVGSPYVLGADRSRRDEFDCSSFTRAMYLDTYGVDIGSTTYDQHPNLPEVTADELRTGDLVFWTVPGDEHTGMVYWDGVTWMVVHAANPQQGVRTDTLESLNGALALIGYRRPEVR